MCVFSSDYAALNYCNKGLFLYTTTTTTTTIATATITALPCAVTQSDPVVPSHAPSSPMTLHLTTVTPSFANLPQWNSGQPSSG